MVAATVVAVDEALQTPFAHAIASSTRAVVVGDHDGRLGLITLDRLGPFLRDADLQRMLRADDLERSAPCLGANASRMDEVRALVGADTATFIVVDADGRTPRGGVTRDEDSSVLVDWYARGNGGAGVERAAADLVEPGREDDVG